MEQLRGGLYDRVLVLLVLLAPLAMLALSKWRASLDGWYATPDAVAMEMVFGATFRARVAVWLQERPDAGAELIVVVDRDCPCTQAALARLDAAREKSRRDDARLTLRYLDDTQALRDPAWRALLGEIPATPTLLAIDQRKLLYAGPVTSGSTCSSAVNRVLGVSILESPGNSPTLNWLQKGCYCRLENNFK